MKLRFSLDPWLSDSYYWPSGVLVAYSDGTEVGRLSFYHERFGNEANGMIHLESLVVSSDFRGKGIGTALHKKLRTTVQRRWPWFQYATGDVTSAGALRLLATVYGSPLFIADAIGRFTFEDALSRLPRIGCTDAEGKIDCDKGYLSVNVWIGRGSPPKDHPWRL